MVSTETCLAPRLIAMVGKCSVDGNVLGQPKAHRGSSDVCKSPHAVAQFCRNASTSWRVQEHPRGRLIARDVELGRRENITGNVVTLWVEFIDEGRKNTARATKDYCPY